MYSVMLCPAKHEGGEFVRGPKVSRGFKSSYDPVKIAPPVSSHLSTMKGVFYAANNCCVGRDLQLCIPFSEKCKNASGK